MVISQLPAILSKTAINRYLTRIFVHRSQKCYQDKNRLELQTSKIKRNILVFRLYISKILEIAPVPVTAFTALI